jgi:hypothetical protein
MKPALLLLGFVAAPLTHGSTGAFEGRVLLRLQDAEPSGASFTLRGDRARIDVPGVGGRHETHAVVDFTRGTVAMTTPGGAWVPVAMFPVLKNPGRVTVHETGHWRAVVAQACEDWRLEDHGRTVEACVVPGVPWFDPRRIVGREVPGWSALLEARRAFPVSVWAAPDTRTVPFAMWATDVVPEPVADDVFAVPRTARVR